MSKTTMTTERYTLWALYTMYRELGNLACDALDEARLDMVHGPRKLWV